MLTDYFCSFCSHTLKFNCIFSLLLYFLHYIIVLIYFFFNYFSIICIFAAWNQVSPALGPTYWNIDCGSFKTFMIDLCSYTTPDVNLLSRVFFPPAKPFLLSSLTTALPPFLLFFINESMIFFLSFFLLFPPPPPPPPSVLVWCLEAGSGESSSSLFVFLL